MASATNSKKRQIMILTSDENIIEQIRKNNSPSSFETIILEPEEDNTELSDRSTTFNTSLRILKKNRVLSVQSSDDRQSTNQKEIKNNSLICVICGSSALGRHFGVISCESCKLFFRRNALKNPTILRCRRNNNCKVTLATRRRCLACRLTKCLNNGMKRERLIRAEGKAIKRRQIKEKRSMILETNEQRSHLRLSTSSDHLSTSSDTNFPSPNFTKWSPQASPQTRRVFLSPEDLQRIEFVQIAFEKRIELTARDGLPWNPSVHATSLLQFLNSRSVPAMRLLTFFRQIPEFNQLNVEDKIILTKYNLMLLVMFNLACSFKTDTKQILETNTDVPLNSSIFQAIFGTEMFPQVKKIFQSLVHIVQYDKKIMPLVLIVLMLTKGLSTGDGAPEPILNDSMAVYRGQNYYIELLWKYMEAEHGFEQAFRIFTKLITRFLTWQIVRKTIRYNTEQNLSTTDENELIPLMKSLFHKS